MGTALVLATTPDVDLYVGALPHRGVTHTVWAALVVGGLVAFAWALAERRPGPDAPSRRDGFPGGPAVSMGGVGGATVLGHLLGDLLTPMGIRPFAPLVTAEYSLALVAARDPTANRVLFVAGVLTAAVALHQGIAHGRRGRSPAVGATRKRREG